MAILGIDEVGRGPLAGPLVVGAVILPSNKPAWIEELKDSKKLSAKKREELNQLILKEAAATGLGWVSAAKLDNIGISDALKLATRLAVKAVQETHISFSQIVIDGKVNFLADTKLAKYVSTMPKADNLIKEVSAASIVAKVARDKYMTELSNKYPQYGFEKHVGYGTAKHLSAIREYGIIPEHRKSFEPIKSMTNFSRPTKTVVKNTTVVGQKAEEKVAEYLTKNGHQIITKNHKTRFAEIDIISIKDNKIYFTEVKYRKTNLHGGGLAAITKEKQAKMKFAAESFLKFKKEYTKYNPLLAVADVSGDDFIISDWFVLEN